jgi:ABC-type antimicrobial peptide transport system permease subunit
MDEFLAGPLAQPRLGALLLSALGLAALLLAVIGLYGVTAAAVREETRDIGVRMALGATPARVRREVVGRALAVTAGGAAVGLVTALAATRLLRTILYEVTPTDPLTLAVVLVLLIVGGVVAAYLPARRATRIDPAEALRGD